MKFAIPVAIALTLVLSSHLMAQTQGELNDEAYAKYKKADAALNESYNKLRDKLDEEGRRKVRDAEKAWIAFRDADAAAEADDYRGGSIWPLIYNDCLAALNEARTAQLKARIKELEDH